MVNEWKGVSLLKGLAVEIEQHVGPGKKFRNVSHFVDSAVRAQLERIRESEDHRLQKNVIKESVYDEMRRKNQ